MLDEKKSFFGKNFDIENEKLRKASINTRAILNFEKNILRDLSIATLFIGLFPIVLLVSNLYLYSTLSLEVKTSISSFFISCILIVLFYSLSKKIGKLFLYNELKSKYKIAYNFIKESTKEYEEHIPIPPFDKSSLEEDSNEEVFCKIDEDEKSEQSFVDKIVIKTAVFFTVIYFMSILVSLDLNLILVCITNIFFLLIFSIFLYRYNHVKNISFYLKDICYRIISDKKYLVLNLQRVLEVKKENKDYFNITLKRSSRKLIFLYILAFISANILAHNGTKGLADAFQSGMDYYFGIPMNFRTHLMSVGSIILTDICLYFYIKSNLERNYYLNLLEKGYSIDDYKKGKGIFIPELSEKNYILLFLTVFFFSIDIIINSTYQIGVLGSDLDSFSIIGCLSPCSVSAGTGVLKAHLKHKIECYKSFVNHTNL